MREGWVLELTELVINGPRRLPECAEILRGLVRQKARAEADRAYGTLPMYGDPLDPGSMKVRG